MRWVRLLSALLLAKFRSRIAISDQSVVSFRVWPTDIDIAIMNHAVIMTVMEMGRVDYMVRSGFFKLAQRKKWYFPSAAVSVQFIRPLKLFQKAEVTTRVFHVNDQWIYIEHKVIRKGKDMAICIVKSKVKKGRENIDTKEIVKELGTGPLPAEGAAIIAAYEQETALMYERLKAD